MEKPEKILQEFSARHPGIWKYVETCRATKGQGHDWPDWCYLPVTATYTYIMTTDPPQAGGAGGLFDQSRQDASLASALTAWRIGRGIYRFDPDLAAALVETPIESDLPVELFYRLPEWCVYLDLTGIAPSEDIHGAFVYLESDYDTGVPELRIFFDADPVMYMIPLHLTAPNIAGMLAESDALGNKNVTEVNDPELTAFHQLAHRHFDSRRSGLLRPVINLILYLCNTEAEYKGGGRPSMPAMIKTKKGPRIFPAATARIWKIGERTGNLLRQARQAPHQPEERNAPRPHLRRAHWHTYRVGQKRQGYRVRWLHPILVGYGE